MDPLIADVYWLSGIISLVTIGILSWLGIRLYQKANPDEKKSFKITLPLWVRILLYLPLGVILIWMSVK